MASMISFSFILALFCYVIVSIYFLRSLLAMANLLQVHTDDETPHDKIQSYRIKRRISLILILVGLVCHALTLYPFLVVGAGNINFNLFNVISLTSLLMLGFSLLFSSYRPIIVLNILATPFAILGLVMGYLNPQAANNTNVANMGMTMTMHIFLSIAAYSVLFMAAIQALLLRLQNRELKHQTKTRVWVRLLPALQTMEKLLFDMIMVGFALLTVALLLGWLGVTDIFAQHIAHKTVFSLLAWVIFAWLIFGHWKFGWRGKLAANMTLWGFGLLAIGFVGTKFVLEMLL